MAKLAKTRTARSAKTKLSESCGAHESATEVGVTAPETRAKQVKTLAKGKPELKEVGSRATDKAAEADLSPNAKKNEKTKGASSQPTAAEKVAAGAKKVSQKLLETIEKRKKAKGGMFGKPAGRRGRRPKNAAEYTPVNQEEDGYVLESDYEGIEYDTGIRLKEGGDTDAFNLDRFEEFDEELNFDG
jgi:hypothetical protein